MRITPKDLNTKNCLNLSKKSARKRTYVTIKHSKLSLVDYRLEAFVTYLLHVNYLTGAFSFGSSAGFCASAAFFSSAAFCLSAAFFANAAF